MTSEGSIAILQYYDEANDSNTLALQIMKPSDVLEQSDGGPQRILYYAIGCFRRHQ